MLKEQLTSLLKDGFVNKSLKVLMLRMGGVALFFSLSLFLTNLFPSHLVGQYDFVRSVLLVVGGLCLLGTDQAIIYFSGVFSATNELGELKSIYKKMVLMILGMSFLLLIIAVCIPESFINSFFEKENAYSLILKTMATLSVFTVTLLNIDTLRALQKPLFSEVYRNIYRHLSFLVLAIALYFSYNQAYIVEAFLGSFLLLAIASTIRVYSAFRAHKDYQPKKAYSHSTILKRSYPMALSSISYFLMQSVDIMLLGKFTDFDTVAYYAVAVKVATLTALVFLSVNIVVAPKVAEFHAVSDKDSLKGLIKKSTRLIAFLSIPAILFLFIFSEFTLSLFGNDFILAKQALWILLIGQIFKSVCGPIAIYLNMTGKQNILQRILLFGLVINIILNWFFIPQYGMVGAALATVISIVLWNAIAMGYIYKKDGVKTFLS